jgi:predicted MFS family arabinose efflux permease
MPSARFTESTAAARRARLAVGAFFFVNGSVVGGWVPHVPDKARELSLNPAQLGLILLSGGFGATIAIPAAGWLISKFGSKLVSTVAGIVMPLALLGAIAAPAAWMMAFALLFLGMSGASMDVAMNAQGVLVEKRLGHRTISLFHGVWSIGGVAGSAGSATAMAHGGSPIVVAATLTASLIAVILIFRAGMIAHADELSHGLEHMTRPHGRLLLLGMLAFCAMLSEGAIADWSGLFLRVVRGLGEGVVGYGYSAFAAAMVIGRLTGDRFVARVSELRALRYGGLLAACGMVLVLATHGLVASLPGFALMGFGLSNVSPILYRSAGQVPGVAPGAGIATAVGIGYAGLLIGPPLLGLLGHATGLPSIFYVVAGLCLMLSLASPVLKHVQS